ncbi:MAG TPA: penicillin acylase family protein [Mycobacteriales bacterium]
MQVRRPLVVLTAALLAGAFVATGAVNATAAGAPVAPSSDYRANDYADGQAMSILPPGANGTATLAQGLAYEADKTQHPPYSQDQLGKYDALSYDSSTLTDATLGNYYDDESFGVIPSKVTKTVTPEAGVTVYYDDHDVPHIFGDSDQTMSFGAGYAQASERLFFMDVLRHYGAGQTSQFLGPSCADEQMDHDQLLLAPYTPAQAQAQVDALPQEYGAKGEQTRSMIESYVAGVNAYITAADADPLNLMPIEYYALPSFKGLSTLPVQPEPWTAGDVVDIAGLIGGIFGKGGGTETADSALYTYLTAKLGTTAGQAAFTAFKSQNDPDAPTTIVDKTFPYEQGATGPTAQNDLPAVDPTTQQVALTGGPTDTTPNCDLTSPNVPGLGAIASLATLPKAFSNALVVDASHSADGHPIAVFGPQVSYFAPQILMQEDLHSPTYAAEGASFPGTGVVELGRGEDYAWSATSAGTDIIDQRLEVICTTDGSAPKAGGTMYEFDGKCLPMTNETFSETALPTAAGTGAPTTIDHEIHLTQHGVVQGWTTDTSGRVVAVVTQRSTYTHDVDSVVGFVDWGTPSATYDEASWVQGAEEIGFTFNWFYVDDRDAGYYNSGLDPVRSSAADPNLPLTGTGNSEWQGYLPSSQHPQEVNPAQGFFVSWNNKPAPGFSASDDQFGYGSTYRSTMLVNALKAQLAAHGGKVTRAQVVQAMETGATQDLDGLTEIPALLSYLTAHPAPSGTPAQDQQMLDLLHQWVADGAHRHKAQESDTQYDHAAAVAISDELIPNLIHAIWDPLLAGGGSASVGSNGGATAEGYGILPAQFTNTPNSGGAHLGSAYDGGWEGYLQDTFAQLQGTTTGDMFASAVTDTWCGNGPSACPGAIWDAITTTEAALVTANGSSTPSSWTASTASAATAAPASVTNPQGTPAQTMPQFDAIAFRAIGLVGTPDIDWQNRPTFQQVVEFPRHRSRTDAPPSSTTTPGSTTTVSGISQASGATGELAFTGGLPGAGAGLALLVAGAAALGLRRQRRAT